jgi:hypothetical protein
VPAVNVWGAPAYVLEQRGFRKLVDTTFVMGFLLSAQVDPDNAAWVIVGRHVLHDVNECASYAA